MQIHLGIVPQSTSRRVDRNRVSDIHQIRSLPLQPHSDNSTSQKEAEEAVGCIPSGAQAETDYRQGGQSRDARKARRPTFGGSQEG